MIARRSFVGAGAGSVLLAAAAIAAPRIVRAQAPVNLRLQGFLAPAATPQKALETLAADLKQSSGGRINLAVLPAGGAVAVTETLNAIANGILDGHYSAPSFFASRDPGFTLLGDTGAAYDSVDQRDRWFREGGGIAVARELYDRYGLYYVDQVFWPSEHIPARRAINGVDDLKGLKIRVPPGMIAEVMNRAGAAVVNLPGAEVFNALQSGVIDATDWASPGQNQEVGLYKAAKFSINASHSMPTTEVSFGKRRWESLPAEVKKLIEDGVKKMNAQLQTQLRDIDSRAIGTIKGEGVQVIDWPKAEVARLRAVTTRVQMELGARNPIARKLLDSHRAFMAKSGLSLS
jgi:TRAP-type mannitol/chloroaromatic compound transport system substrate-binding protein